jgi:hypothetical protein
LIVFSYFHILQILALFVTNELPGAPLFVIFEGWVGFDLNSPGYRHLSKLPSNQKNVSLAPVAGYAKRN